MRGILRMRALTREPGQAEHQVAKCLSLQFVFIRVPHPRYPRTRSMRPLQATLLLRRSLYHSTSASCPVPTELSPHTSFALQSNLVVLSVPPRRCCPLFLTS